MCVIRKDNLVDVHDQDEVDQELRVARGVVRRDDARDELEDPVPRAVAHERGRERHARVADAVRGQLDRALLAAPALRRGAAFASVAFAVVVVKRCHGCCCVVFCV